jgi:hypothetical protein
MVDIRTFHSDHHTADAAIRQAEEAAAEFLQTLDRDQIIQVQAQTLATNWQMYRGTDSKTELSIAYLHVITVVSVPHDSEEHP